MENEVDNCIVFENSILKGEKKTERWTKSEHLTLFQLMDDLGNVNRAISVVGYWIFDSNYKKALVRNIESLDMICAQYVGEEEAAEFEKLFSSVRYICFDAQLKKD